MSIAHFLQNKKTSVFFETLVRNHPPGSPPKRELILRGAFVFEGKVIGHEEVPYKSPEDITAFFTRSSRNIRDVFARHVRALREKEQARALRRVELDRLCEETNAAEIQCQKREKPQSTVIYPPLIPADVVRVACPWTPMAIGIRRLTHLNQKGWQYMSDEAIRYNVVRQGIWALQQVLAFADFKHITQQITPAKYTQWMCWEIVRKNPHLRDDIEPHLDNEYKDPSS